VEGIGHRRAGLDLERGPQVAAALREERGAHRKTLAVELGEAADGRAIIFRRQSDRDSACHAVSPFP
jgi:hypothetical protein